MKLSRVKEPSEALPKCPPIFESILNLALPGEPNIFEIDDKKCGR